MSHIRRTQNAFRAFRRHARSGAPRIVAKGDLFRGRQYSQSSQRKRNEGISGSSPDVSMAFLDNADWEFLDNTQFNFIGS